MGLPVGIEVTDGIRLRQAYGATGSIRLTGPMGLSSCSCSKAWRVGQDNAAFLLSSGKTSETHRDAQRRISEHEDEQEHEHVVAEDSAGEQTQVTVPMPEHESYPQDHEGSDTVTDEKRERHCGAGETAAC